MLHNLNWLNKGEMFPPKSERARLKTYLDNRQLFNGDTERVLPAYRQRIRNILNKYTDVPQSDYKSDLNYWQLVTLKTGDLICGEPPTIGIGGDSSKIDDLRLETKFNTKLLKAVYDVSMLGECVARVMKNSNNKNNFTITNPGMWFPIVSEEDMDDVICHIVAWIKDISTSENKKEFMLRVQEHYKGYYINRAFKIDDYNLQSTTILSGGLNIELPTYKIGNEIIQESKKIPTGLDDFAIVPLQNVTLSDSPYAAVNDYDRITSILAELEVRYALENVVLDKHSAPTVHAPENALSMVKSGEWVLPLGGVIATRDGDQLPGYMTWDGSLENNHIMIEKLEKHLFSLSEMGAIINDDAFGASQGFEALETRLTNARLKARRLSSCLIDSVKKLIDLISQIGYERIRADDISIVFNDGVPNNEYRETDIAVKKMPLFSSKTLLKEHYAKSDEDAEKELEQRTKEMGDSMGGGFSLGIGGGGNDGQSEG